MSVFGRILKGIGGFYYVDMGDDIITCRARGKLRKMGVTPYVGDIAEIDVQSDGTGFVLGVKERKNLMERPPIANIDQIVVVASKAPPETDAYFIDRIAAIAIKSNIPVAVAINKCDEDSGEALSEIYKNTNIRVFKVSAKSGYGILSLTDFLSGKLTALAGNSGVGKSSIINEISGNGIALETGEINKKIGRGKHTTRQVEILKISKDTWIADTPGFSAFDFSKSDEITKEDLAELFGEFEPFTDKCRFNGCLHSKEDGCAVVRAVKDGIISKSRHSSYVRMLDEIKAVKKYK